MKSFVHVCDMQRKAGRLLQSVMSGDLRQRTQPLRRTKMVLVGRGRAGKTSTLNSLLGKKFDPHQASTVGCAWDGATLCCTEADTSEWCAAKDGVQMAKLVHASADRGSVDEQLNKPVGKNISTIDDHVTACKRGHARENVGVKKSSSMRDAAVIHGEHVR